MEMGRRRWRVEMEGGGGGRRWTEEMEGGGGGWPRVGRGAEGGGTGPHPSLRPSMRTRLHAHLVGTEDGALLLRDHAQVVEQVTEAGRQLHLRRRGGLVEGGGAQHVQHTTAGSTLSLLSELHLRGERPVADRDALKVDASRRWLLGVVSVDGVGASRHVPG